MRRHEHRHVTCIYLSILFDVSVTCGIVAVDKNKNMTNKYGYQIKNLSHSATEIYVYMHVKQDHNCTKFEPGI